MTGNSKRSADALPEAISGRALHQRAEAVLRENDVQSAESLDTLSSEEIKRLLYELSVHQVELKMQNENLHQSYLALETSQARYLDLYHMAPVGYCNISEQGLILQANPAAATLLGVSRNKLVKRVFARHILKEDADIYYLCRTRCKMNGEPMACELRMVKRDGAQFWAKLEIVAVQDRGASALLIVLNDISPQKQAEDALRKSEERLKFALEGSGDGMWDWNIETGEVLYSKRWKELLGFAESEIGNDINEWAKRVHPEDMPGVVVNQQANAKGITDTTVDELRMLCKDGSWKWMLGRGMVVSRDADGKPLRMVGTLSDISGRKQTEEQLLKMAAGLDGMVGERTKQLRDISAQLTMTEERERRLLAQDLHDNLGQLLAVIKIKLTLLDADSPPSSVRQIIDLVDQAEQAARMIYSELSPPILQTLGLMPAFQWLADEMERRYQLAVQVNIYGEPKPLIKEIQAMLFRSVRELLINIAKHAKVNEASLSCLNDGNWMSLVVSDSGCGFDQFDGSGFLPECGGFGLNSVHERIVNLGGEMEIDSSPGNGTTITLSLPHHVIAAKEPQ